MKPNFPVHQKFPAICNVGALLLEIATRYGE